jgi:hypothetical protein
VPEPGTSTRRGAAARTRAAREAARLRDEAHDLSPVSAACGVRVSQGAAASRSAGPKVRPCSEGLHRGGAGQPKLS